MRKAWKISQPEILKNICTEILCLSEHKFLLKKKVMFTQFFYIQQILLEKRVL